MLTLMNTTISFRAMALEYLPYWYKWAQKPHVKSVWFLDGYETPDYIHQKIVGNGYDHPFIICLNNEPIGYICCCDLYAYRTICPKPKGLFTNEEPGTFCMDLYIGEEDFLDKGYGTLIVKAFANYIFELFKAKKLLIDPDINNKRAIRCYEKAGFIAKETTHDGVTDALVMEFDQKG